MPTPVLALLKGPRYVGGIISLTCDVVPIFEVICILLPSHHK